MAGEPLTYWDYVKAAFCEAACARACSARMPVNQMRSRAFGLAGFGNPGFWLLGLRRRSSTFWAGARRARASRSWSRPSGSRRAPERRGPDAAGGSSGWRRPRSRYRALVGSAARSWASAPRSGEASGSTDFRAGSLNQLLWLFLRLLTSREVITDTLAHVDRRQLEAGVEALQARGSRPPATRRAPLARSLQATLEIQEKRLENLDRAAKSLAVIDAELERIEQQVRLIREETAVSGGPEVLSARLDAVTSTLAETSRWMDQHAELLGGLTSVDSTRAACRRCRARRRSRRRPEEPCAPAPPRPAAAARQRPEAMVMAEADPSARLGRGDAPGLPRRRHQPVRALRQRLRPGAGAGRQGRVGLRLARATS